MEKIIASCPRPDCALHEATVARVAAVEQAAAELRNVRELMGRMPSQADADDGEGMAKLLVHLTGEICRFRTALEQLMKMEVQGSSPPALPPTNWAVTISVVVIAILMTAHVVYDMFVRFRN